MPIRAFKTSRYLTTPEDRAAYLDVVIAEGDPKLFYRALKEIAESEGADFSLQGVDLESDFQALFGSQGHQGRLNQILHGLGLRLSVSCAEYKGRECFDVAVHPPVG